MKKAFFKVINNLNKKFLPSYLDKDPTKLTKLQKAIVAFRYNVLIQSK